MRRVGCAYHDVVTMKIEKKGMHSIPYNDK